MARYLNPQSDLVFKRIFGEHKRLLKSFLNAILPLTPDQQIVSLEYLPSEQVPKIPELKRPIVDVKCTDKLGRIFIVEMQIEWITEFMNRMLFNTSTAYVSQLASGEPYEYLQPVYGVALLADNFDKQTDQWYHHYKMVNIEHTNQTIEGLQLIFIELKKFKAARHREKTLQTLWLRFMSELDEHTFSVPDEIIAVDEIKEALTLAEEAAYTRAEMNYLARYWDSVRTEKTLISGKFRAGKLEGKLETARTLLKKGIPIETIIEATGLSEKEIRNQE